ncbi:MAG: DUF4079 domain-containing protein [Cyanothece sp. SIO1E1]|nr:DUF4079 domain-containing protein [Cyanothece sp. SIO1E1]
MPGLQELLEPIAEQVRSLGLPQPIIHWGHPLMMGIVVVVMGTFVGIAGWRGRTAIDAEVSTKNRASHRQIAPWMFTFIALGYTGGVLSLVTQGQPILESPHFWTGSAAVLLLGLNGVFSLGGFLGDRAALRTTHAYVGSLALVVLLVHALLGLQLGLSF